MKDKGNNAKPTSVESFSGSCAICSLQRTVPNGEKPERRPIYKVLIPQKII